MKRLLILTAILMLLFCPLVYAEETSGATHTTPYPPLTNWLNSNSIDHTHQYVDLDTDTQVTLPSRKTPVGLGLDLILYEGDELYLEKVTLEIKRDLANKENSFYAVATLNIWDVFKK